MKIALVSEYYYPLLGGITEHVHNLAQTLQRRGHDVTVVTNNLWPGKKRQYPEETPLFRVKRFGRGWPVFSNGSFARVTVSVKLAFDLRDFFAREQFDIIHAHSPLTPILPLVAIRNSNAPVTVGTFHTYFDQSRGYHAFNRQASNHLQKLDGRIAVSEACIEALDRYFDSEYAIIPNGVDTARFHPEATAPESMDDGRLNILFAGRFDPRNGLKTMIEAFRLVKRRFDACRLVIVGDGPLKPYYRALAGRDLADDIHFAGMINGGRPGYYAAADIFCTPCKKASFGVVLLEAMASRTPIVASDINGYRSVMQNGRQGLLVPCDSPEAFAQALLLLLKDPDLRRSMGHEGRRTVINGFSWDSVGEKVEAFYSRLLHGESAAFDSGLDLPNETAPLSLVP